MKDSTHAKQKCSVAVHALVNAPNGPPPIFGLIVGLVQWTGPHGLPWRSGRTSPTISPEVYF